MADVQRRVTKAGEVRWDVRYRDDARQQRKRSFGRKVDAQRFARSVETDLLRGDWIDPRRGKELFGVWAEMWMETLGSRKPKTRESYESIVHRHLLPRFATTPIASIDYPCVLAFVGGLKRDGLGAGTVRNIRDVLRLVLGLAVKSGALKANPVTDVEVSRTGRAEMIFLDPDQIMTLAAEVNAPPERYRREERRRDGYPEYGLLVRFAAFTGLRAGELVALRDFQPRLDAATGRGECLGVRGLRRAAARTDQDLRAPNGAHPQLPDRRARRAPCGRRSRRLRVAERAGRSVPLLELVQASLQAGGGFELDCRPARDSTISATATPRC